MLSDKIDAIENAVRNSPSIMRYDEDQYHYNYWAKVVPAVCIEGLWLEFGVFRGRSIQRISSLTQNNVYGFDSFDGLHETWDTNNPKGVYNSGGMIPSGAIVGDNHSMFDASPTSRTEPWNPNVFLIKGYFADTLPDFLLQHTEQAAFIHIDSDLYSSCATVLDLLRSRVSNGTIICFDELLDYPSYKDHEIKAFAEFLLSTGYDFEPLIYHGVGAEYTQACVKILS